MSWENEELHRELLVALSDHLDGMLDDLDRIQRRLTGLLEILRQYNDQFGSPDRR